MEVFRIQGPNRLHGTVRASGAKNAALPALTASLLLGKGEALTLHRVPRVRDVGTMRKLLSHLNIDSEERDDHAVVLAPHENGAPSAPYELVKTMRASVLTLGPMLARKGRARVSLPGGCAIGVRPIDQHLAGLEAMGAEVQLEHGYVEARADRLRGAHYEFAMPTVTGTENLMMAATLARGTTVLENCAREPEIGDLGDLLCAMGAKIEGAGSERIEIEGVETLHSAEHRVIPDRIEGGTYLIGALLTGGDVRLEDTAPADLAPLLDVLAENGASIDTSDNYIRVYCNGPLRAYDVNTCPHPGFPTDLQAQYMALMTSAHGVSTVCENVFENRFQHVPELVRMGANIRLDGRFARVEGPTPLSGANVMATDLRASACLVLAGLAAEGETIVHRIYHLDRGYEQMELKLHELGARVERCPEPD